MKQHAVHASIVLTLLVPLSACGASDDARSSTDASVEAVSIHGIPGLVKLLRQTVSYDYEPFKSPSSMRDAAPIVVLGQVDSVEAGLIDGGDEPLGVILITLNVKESWKAKSEPSRVTFAVRRPKNLDAAKYRDALPVGSRVVLFGDDTGQRLTEGASDGPLYEPLAQGLLLETAEGSLVNVWGADVTSDQWVGLDTINELRSSLKS
jgi:hypothetical protein